MRSAKRLVDLLTRKSFLDYVFALNNHIDPKEITECMAMFNIVRKILKDEDVDIIFDIGCGKRPSLGTIMALNYKKPVICIDPQLNTSLCKNIKDIQLYNVGLEEWDIPPDIKNLKALVLCNHAHTSKVMMEQFLSNFKDWTYITCPCCKNNKFDFGRYTKDYHSWSDKNEIFIFKKSEIDKWKK